MLVSEEARCYIIGTGVDFETIGVTEQEMTFFGTAVVNRHRAVSQIVGFRRE